METVLVVVAVVSLVVAVTTLDQRTAMAVVAAEASSQTATTAHKTATAMAASKHKMASVATAATVMGHHKANHSRMDLLEGSRHSGGRVGSLPRLYLQCRHLVRSNWFLLCIFLTNQKHVLLDLHIYILRFLLCMSAYTVLGVQLSVANILKPIGSTCFDVSV